MSPNLQLIKASIVANQGLPNINGCPPNLYFRCKTVKYTGYSQESKETIISSNTPYGFNVDVSINCKTLCVS